MSNEDGSDPAGGAAPDPDEAGDHRDRAATQRDEAGEQRDAAGDVRDARGDKRDGAGDVRDQAGATRDRAALSRDEAARLEEGSINPPSGDSLLGRLADSRKEAADDRMEASRDRAAGAGDRAQSGRDRVASRADRDAGLTERSTSGEDRTEAFADRSAAAQHRASSAIDASTTAYVRAAGLIELRREMARTTRSGEPLSLAFLDVDGLKAINDGHGHATGDQVLAAVVDAIRSLVRPYDVIVRYGGDEFLCVFAGLDISGATARLTGINDVLAEGQLAASVSIGVAVTVAGDTTDSLIARADADLYSQRARSRTMP